MQASLLATQDQTHDTSVLSSGRPLALSRAQACDIIGESSETRRTPSGYGVEERCLLIAEGRVRDRRSKTEGLDIR